MPSKTKPRTRQGAKEARKRQAAATLKNPLPSGKKVKKLSKIASDESVATSDTADDSGSEGSPGNTLKTNTGKGGKPDSNGPPTILKVLDQLTIETILCVNSLGTWKMALPAQSKNSPVYFKTTRSPRYCSCRHARPFFKSGTRSFDTSRKLDTEMKTTGMESYSLAIETIEGTRSPSR